jgi:hypothetical protein
MNILIGVSLAVITTAYTFYQIGYNHGETDGYIDAMLDVKEALDK